MRKMIAILCISLLSVGMVAAYDVRETSWGVPFLAPDPSLKTTDPFYGNQGAAYIGPVDTASYQLPPVLTQKTLSNPQTQGDPWMASGPRKKSETVNLTAFSLNDLTGPQIDRMTNVSVEGAPWI
jgi:hypothetical protein